MIIDFISDLHLGVGHHDPRAIDAYCAFAAENPPDERVWGGDIAEFSSMNSRGPEGYTLDMELGAVRDQIMDLMARAPAGADHFVAGNHENRYERMIKKMLPEAGSALPTLQELLNLEDLGFSSFTGFKQVLVMHGIGFTHGTYSGQNHAQIMLRKFPYNVVYGHTHNPQTAWAPQFATIAGRWACGSGCLRTLDPGWAQGPTGWTSGFVRIYVDGPVITPYSIVMQEGRFIGPDGRTYG